MKPPVVQPHNIIADGIDKPVTVHIGEIRRAVRGTKGLVAPGKIAVAIVQPDGTINIGLQPSVAVDIHQLDIPALSRAQLLSVLSEGDRNGRDRCNLSDRVVDRELT